MAPNPDKYTLCGSISLYAINPMVRLVPENHTQWSNWIHGIRLLTPDLASFTSSKRCFNAKPGGMVSSLMMEHSLAFGPEFCHSSRGDVLRDHLLLPECSFDPHVKEVGKK